MAITIEDFEAVFVIGYVSAMDRINEVAERSLSNPKQQESKMLAQALLALTDYLEGNLIADRARAMQAALGNEALANTPLAPLDKLEVN